MKKVILLFILLLLPIGVFAKTCDTNKVKITSIEMTDKSDGVTENEEANFKGLEANVDLKFNQEGEHIEYKIIVKNDNNEDFELTKNDIKTEYFNYKYIYDDNTPIVKANSEKQINLRIDYYHSVPQELINNGFVEKKQILLNLSNDKKITNPKTSKTTIIGLILVLLGLSTIIFVSKNKKEPALLLLLILFLPIGVFALCNICITTNSKIEIGKEVKEFCYNNRGFEEINAQHFEYEDGMTWQEFLNSDYNLVNDPNSTYTYYFDKATRNSTPDYKNKRPIAFMCESNNCPPDLDPRDPNSKILDKSFGCYIYYQEQ